jgi:hypothetical protein
MTFDYTVAAAIARYEPVHTERLRDFAYAARQTWDELQLSKRDSISLQREIRNLLGEIDVLKNSLLEAEAAPQPVVPEWISVDERLPEEETPVLAIVDGYDGLLTVERRWERCDQMTEPYYKDFLYWDWVDNDGQDLEGKVRFWMRLPEMPALLSAGKGGEHD